MLKTSNSAVFLDRDGTLVTKRDDYVKSIDELIILNGAVTGLRALNSTRKMIIVVTNQSVVGRGIITMDDLQAINNAMVDQFHSHGIKITDVISCTHTPEDNCSCRKPRNGMFLEAMEKYNIDLRESIMIGDSEADMEAAKTAGIGHTILVETNNGIDFWAKSMSIVEQVGVSGGVQGV